MALTEKAPKMSSPHIGPGPSFGLFSNSACLPLGAQPLLNHFALLYHQPFATPPCGSAEPESVAYSNEPQGLKEARQSPKPKVQ